MNRCAVLLAVAASCAWNAAAPAQERKEIAVIPGNEAGPYHLVFSQDGKMLASLWRGRDHWKLKLLDVATGREIGTLLETLEAPNAFAFSPDGKRLAAAARDRVWLWEIATRKELAAFPVDHGVALLAFSQDGKMLAATNRKRVWSWHVPSATKVSSVEVLVRNGGRTTFSPDLRTLAAPNYPEIDLWDVVTGKERLILSEHRGAVKVTAFSPDGKTLAAASNRTDEQNRWHGEVKLWDTTTGRERARLEGPFGHVTELVFGPDGKQLALLDWKEFTGNEDLRLIDLPTGRGQTLHRGKRLVVCWLGFTSAGRLRFATTDPDRTIRVWEVGSRLPSRARSAAE